MSDRQAQLRRRRPAARRVYASRVRAGDVLHPAGAALVVLEVDDERRHHPLLGERVVLRVVDEYPTGATFVREVLAAPLREVLASRVREPRNG